jgi:NADPH:quinone reductase-like Zn-dependent oxidoreductase
MDERSLVRAVTLDSFDSPPRLRDDMPEPSPSDNEVVVRVLASSANPADAAVAGGAVKEMIQHDFPVTLGRDFAGVVEGTGEQVYGFVPLSNPTVHGGSWAEFIAVPEDNWFAQGRASSMRRPPVSRHWLRSPLSAPSTHSHRPATRPSS